MSEFPPPHKPPETKYAITADEFLKAANGEPFQATNWFYRKTGKELTYGGYAAELGWIHLQKDIEYLVLREATCHLPINSEGIYLENLNKSAEKLCFLFYKSVLPTIYLTRSNTGHWIFIQSDLVAGNLIIENSEVGEVTIRDDCEISYVVLRNGSKCPQINVVQSRGREIIIEDSVVGKTSFHLTFEYDLSINNNSRVDETSITYSIPGSIHIAGASELSVLNIENSMTKYIKLRNKSQIGEIRIEQSSTENIMIEDNSQCKRFEIGKSCKSGSIAIINSHVGQVRFNENYCRLYLSGATASMIHLINCHLYELAWQGGTRGDLYFQGGHIRHFQMDKTILLKDATVSLINAEIDIIQLQELAIEGQLVFRNIKRCTTEIDWQELVLSRESLWGKYSQFVREVQNNVAGSKIPLIRIADSSLGRMEITGSDLRQYLFEYCDSKLLNIFLSGTQLPREDIVVYNLKESSSPNKREYEQKIVFYNQLKRIFENEGDIVESTWYHAKGMEVQEKLLKLKFDEKYNSQRSSMRNWFTDERFDLWAFRLNRLSNNHGESWRKALGFTVISSLTMYCCYYVSVNYQKSFSLKGTGDFLGNYFLFLDITHKPDFMSNKGELSFISKILDFLGRILIGYGIYQLISAFRRHGRKAG